MDGKAELTTYQVLVYHSRANRSFKTFIQQILREYNLTMMQWTVLGFIRDAGNDGIRISDLAQQVDSSLAFITNSVNALEEKGMVYRVGHGTDSRAKLVYVAADYVKKLGEIEENLSKQLTEWFASRMNNKEVALYVQVLRKMAGVQ